MNSSVYKISLDIHSPESQILLDMKQFDTGRQLQISLAENGWIYPITSDCSAVFTAEKADGNKIYNECLLSGNVIVYDVTQQTTACVGEVACEIRLFNGEGVLITSPRFTIVVNERVYNGEEIVDSLPEADVLQELVSDAKKLYGEISENTKKAHTHGNKPVLDSITQETLDKIGKCLTEEQEADLTANTKARHTHGNKKTIDGFYCEALETGFQQDASSTDLKWNGASLRFANEGAVVDRVEPTVNEEGKNVFRLWLDWGNSQFVINKDYVDIPVESVKDTVFESGDVILNGSELQFTIGGSGVYVGPGDMPSDCNVQINPEGMVLDVPTKTSELENDSGFITSEQLDSALAEIQGGIDEAKAIVDETNALIDNSGVIE